LRWKVTESGYGILQNLLTEDCLKKIEFIGLDRLALCEQLPVFNDSNL